MCVEVLKYVGVCVEVLTYVCVCVCRYCIYIGRYVRVCVFVCVRVCVCVNIRKWGENMFMCKQHMVGKCACPPTY